jgi:MoaA/NifB/PqqE/SkfB family radical SAM enzyme
MHGKQADQWLTEIAATQPLNSVTLHGGEPFLYFDVMRAILSKARALNVEHRWVITNGFWAQSSDVAMKKLRTLKKTGLTAITFSVDAFHQEYVSLDRVRTGIEIAAYFGLDKVAVDSYFLFTENNENSYNIQTRKSLESLNMVSNVEFNKFAASFEGRAAQFLVKQDFIEGKMPDGKCGPPSWLGNSLKDPRTIEIDYEGNITLCPGICIGNAKKQPLTEIIRQYDYERHPIIRIIVEKGPIGLFELAESKGYKGTQRFVNECHLCYEMRKYLHTQYPRYLAPQGCYYDG